MKLENHNRNAGYSKHCSNQLEQAIVMKGKALFSASPFAKAVSYQEKLAGFRLRRELGVEGLLIFKAASLEVVLAQPSRVITTWDVCCEDRVALALDLNKGRVPHTDFVNRSPVCLERTERVGDLDSSLVENHTWSNENHVGQKQQQHSAWDAAVGGLDAGAGDSKSNCDCDCGEEVNPSQSRSDDVFLTHHTILAVTMKAKG
jgi:hypothetical protein